MSVERLREILAEAPPGPWDREHVFGEIRSRGVGFGVIDNADDAALVLLAPEAVALLADTFDIAAAYLADHAPDLLDRLDSLAPASAQEKR